MNYLSKPYAPALLEKLPVSGTVEIDGIPYLSLRDHVRKAITDGDIKNVTGVQAAGLRRADCIAVLRGDKMQCPVCMGQRTHKGNCPTCGEAGEESPVELLIDRGGIHKANGTNGSAAAVPAGAQDTVAQAMATLAAAFGTKVNPDDIRAQVAEITEPVVNGMKLFIETQRIANDEMRAQLLAGRPVTIEVKHPDGSIKSAGRQHFLFPLLVQIAAARCHAYLAGPAGSFKTSTCHAVADALKLPFYATSVCQQTTKTDLLGFFVPGTGEYKATDFRRAYENGGVFLLDEIDAGNANVLAVLNAALANARMGFPDGMITRHADFILLAAGNTYGQGADRQYVGRNQLDAATLDRFAFVDFPYDTGIEALYCGIEDAPSPSCNLKDGGTVTANEWLAFVQKVRASAEKQKIRAVFSTRASIYGVKLAAQGIGRKWMERLLIWKGLDDATIAKIKGGL